MPIRFFYNPNREGATVNITNTQKEQLAAAGIVMFGVPMGGYSGMLESMLDGAGGNMQSVINQLADLPYFKSLFAGDNGTIATKLAASYGFSSTVGGLGQQVKDFFSTQLNNGVTVPQLIKIANDFLFSTNAPEYADTKKLFLNKIAVANAYTYDFKNTSQDLNELKQAIASVGVSDDSTVSARIELFRKFVGGNKFNPQVTTLTSGADTFTGTHANDNVNGGTGNDTLDGGGGNDKLVCDGGNDILKGGKGQDVLIGGTGADQLVAGTFHEQKSDYVNGKYVTTHTFDTFSELLQGEDGADTLLGGYGSDHLDGGSGADQITGDSEAYNWSDASADQLRSMLNDTILGGDGDDRIDGSYGTDWIDGGSGNDTISMPTGGGVAKGGDGDDRINGSQGNDTLDGGAGNDSFYFYSYAGGTDSIDGGAGNDTVIWQGNSQSSVTINAGSGDDSVTLNGFDGTASITAGEGADKITIGNGSYTIDLTETTASKDTITLNIAVGGNDPMTISKVKGFNVASDMIDVGNYHLIKNSSTLGSTINSGDYSSSDGTLRGDYVQFLNSPTTALQGPQGSSASSYANGKTSYNVDFYGKGIFVITGASAAAADTATVAAFLNPYGNNATYLSGETHYFMVNIQNQGAALYYFKDDTGANNNIVADELTPQLMLIGVTTESLSHVNFG